MWPVMQSNCWLLHSVVAFDFLFLWILQANTEKNLSRYLRRKPLYQARESSLVPDCLLTVHFLQKTQIYEAFVIVQYCNFYSQYRVSFLTDIIQCLKKTLGFSFPTLLLKTLIYILINQRQLKVTARASGDCNYVMLGSQDLGLDLLKLPRVNQNKGPFSADLLQIMKWQKTVWDLDKLQQAFICLCIPR